MIRFRRLLFLADREDHFRRSGNSGWVTFSFAQVQTAPWLLPWRRFTFGTDRNSYCFFVAGRFFFPFSFSFGMSSAFTLALSQ